MKKLVFVAILGVFVLLISLSATSKPSRQSQFQPCVMPNPCSKIEKTFVANQFEPCVWPNCSGR